MIAITTSSSTSVNAGRWLEDGWAVGLVMILLLLLRPVARRQRVIPASNLR